MLLVFGSINLDLTFRAPQLPRPGQTVLGHSLLHAAGVDLSDLQRLSGTTGCASVAAGLSCTRAGAQASQPDRAEIEAALPRLASAWR